MQNIIDAILEDIRKEREGELIEVDLLKKVVEIFLFLSTDKLSHESINCKKQLEDRILEQTRQFYRMKSQELLIKASLSEYLHQANKYYVEERERLQRYLTWGDISESLIKEFKTEMLLNHQKTLLERESGIKYLLSQDKLDDLGLLYSLYSDNQDYLQPISIAFKDHVL